MTMTTQNAIPKPPAAPKSATVETDEIVARPLQMPDFVSLKPKNKNIRLRWINFKVGRDQSTLRYDQALAQGYENAHVSDLVSCPQAYIKDGGSKVINGDVILMKIGRAAYDGAKLYNRQKAERLVSRSGKLDRATKDVRKAVTDSGAPRELAGKISTFLPGEDETNALVGK